MRNNFAWTANRCKPLWALLFSTNWKALLSWGRCPPKKMRKEPPKVWHTHTHTHLPSTAFNMSYLSSSVPYEICLQMTTNGTANASSALTVRVMHAGRTDGWPLLWLWLVLCAGGVLLQVLDTFVRSPLPSSSNSRYYISYSFPATIFVEATLQLWSLKLYKVVKRHLEKK